MPTPRVLIRDASILASSTVVSAALSGVVGLATARLLAPELFGIYQALRVIWQYASYANLGVPWSMQQDIARAEGRGDNASANAAIDLAFSVVGVASSVAGMAIVAGSMLFRWPAPTVLALPLAAWLILSQLYGLALLAVSSRRQFWLAGRIDVVTSLLNLLLTGALALAFSLVGVLLAQVIWCVIGLGALLRFGPLRPRWRFDFRAGVAAVAFGLQLTFNGVLFLTLKSVDRILVLTLLGSAALGLYGLSLLLAGYFELLAGAISRTLFPSIIGSFEQRRNMADIRGYVITVSVALGLATPVVAGFAALVIPALVSIFLPQYVAGVSAAQILVLASTFVTLRYTIEYFFVAISKLPRTFAIQLGAILLSFSVAFVAIQSGMGLVGAAYGTLAAHMFNSIGLLAYAFWHYEQDIRHVGHFLLITHGPALYCLAVLLLLETYWPEPSGFTWDHAGSVATKFVVFGVAVIPFVLETHRRFGVLTMFHARLRLLIERRALHGIPPQPE